MAVTESRQLDEELAGLDALDLAGDDRPNRVRRAWSSLWPKLAALALFHLVWQVVVWSGWRPEYVLPPPAPVYRELWRQIGNGTILDAVWLTMGRAARGFALALVLGTVVGAFVSRIAVLRTAVGSMITGLQTMPSIAWFPLAILLFKLSEGAIMFVVVLGAAPSIANGVVAGADQVPPVLLRAGKVLGARGITLWRHVVLPASLPGYVAGVKQGWAFAWRSLMAGELLVIVAGKQSVGVLLQTARDFSRSADLVAAMVLIWVIGVTIDALVFGQLERTIARRRGLLVDR
jgi:NitT/TauT family transport system permease protein